MLTFIPDSRISFTIITLKFSLKKILVDSSCLYNAICIRLNLCISLLISESDKICIIPLYCMYPSQAFLVSLITGIWGPRQDRIVIKAWTLRLITDTTTDKFYHYGLCYRLKLLDKLEVLTIRSKPILIIKKKTDIGLPDWILVWMCQLKSLQKLSVMGYAITEQSLRYVHCLNNLL